MLSYLPLRTYVLPLLIIGSIFSLKAQEEEPKAPEEEPIKRYKGFKLEFAVFTRLSIYAESPVEIANTLEEGDGGESIGEAIGKYGFGIVHLAPQYYINNNISVGLQYEYDRALYNIANIFMATGDYYLGNGGIRPAFGLGVGLNFHKQINFDDIASDIGDSFANIINTLVGEEEEEEDSSSTIDSEESITTLVLSPRFKLHMNWFILHLGYDINIDEKVPNGLRLGIAFTLFGKKK